MSISPSQFEFVRKLVLDRSAISLDGSKEYLVESRLSVVAAKHGIKSVSDLITLLQTSKPNGLLRQVIDAMTTNETYFFRDIHPFETLRKEVIPRLLAARATERRLSIWCGASSTGQEPYSVAMLVRESFPQLSTWNVRILATDIAEGVLERARDGRYNQLEINRGLAAPLVVRYFRQDGQSWQLKEEIRRMVEFRLMNLAESWSAMPSMDLILLRNVLIYFNPETKRSILHKIKGILKPDGFLLLGGSESTIGSDDSYQRLHLGKTICYQPPGTVASGPREKK